MDSANSHASSLRKRQLIRRAAPRRGHASNSRRLRGRVGIGSMAASTEELKAYFDQHSIQPRLNEWLNELVKARPSAPFAWLATRMRAAEPAATVAAAVTVPAVSPAAGAEIATSLTAKWQCCEAFRTPPSAGATAKPAAAAAPSKASSKASSKGVVLTIEPGGKSSVLLCIRRQ